MTKRGERSNATTGDGFSRYWLASSFWCIGRRLNLGTCSLAVTLGSTLLLGVGPGLAQVPGVSRPEAAGASIEGVVTVADPQGQVDAVTGVLVRLTRSSSAESLSATTDAEGRYAFTKLSSGSYTIEARLDGFKPFAESLVVKQGDSKIENVRLELDKVVQKIEVRDKAAAVSTESADSTATVSSRQFTTLPLAEQKFNAALPLVPGVVRTKDGKLNFKGAPEKIGRASCRERV